MTALTQQTGYLHCGSSGESVGEALRKKNEQLTYLLRQEQLRAKESEQHLKKEMYKLRRMLVMYSQERRERYVAMQQYEEWLKEQLCRMKDKYRSIDEECKYLQSENLLWLEMEKKKTNATEKLNREIKKNIALRVKIQHMKEKTERQVETASQTTGGQHHQEVKTSDDSSPTEETQTLQTQDTSLEEMVDKDAESEPPQVCCEITDVLPEVGESQILRLSWWRRLINFFIRWLNSKRQHLRTDTPTQSGPTAKAALK